MFYTLGGLVSIGRRGFQLIGDGFSTERNCFRLTAVKVDQAEKPGVLRLTSPVKIQCLGHIALVKLNPILLAQGEITAPNVLTSTDTELSITLRPLVKDFGISDLEWFAELYVFDTKLTEGRS